MIDDDDEQTTADELMRRRLECFRQQTLITRLGSRPSKRAFKRASLRR